MSHVPNVSERAPMMMEAKPAGACAAAAAAMSLLEQAAGFIERIDDGSYSRPSTLLKGGTIGKHFRHVVDHFAATLAPLRMGVDHAGSTIAYDRRERNVPMETCRQSAIGEIQRVMAQLCRAGEDASSNTVTVRLMLTADGAEREFRSTLGRELAFASHHAVHHHAMIQVMAGEFGLSAPEGFGKAPATLNFERTSPGPC